MFKRWIKKKCTNTLGKFSKCTNTFKQSLMSPLHWGLGEWWVSIGGVAFLLVSSRAMLGFGFGGLHIPNTQVPECNAGVFVKLSRTQLLREAYLTIPPAFPFQVCWHVWRRFLFCRAKRSCFFHQGLFCKEFNREVSSPYPRVRILVLVYLPNGV